MTGPEANPERDRRQRPDEGEHGPGLQPRIYIASLADYNAGRLHGVWLDAAQDLGELESAVQEMLASSPESGAEEYAIHDYDEFGCAHPHEFTDLATISKLADGIAQHGCGFGIWAEEVGHDPNEMDRFEEVYLGRWDSLADYAGELLDDLGVTRQIEDATPEWVRPYVSIDLDGLGREMTSGGVAVEGAAGVWVFGHA
jgi:antirestriction protein